MIISILTFIGQLIFSFHSLLIFAHICHKEPSLNLFQVMVWALIGAEPIPEASEISLKHYIISLDQIQNVKCNIVAIL